jgi:hypothetical protein
MSMADWLNSIKEDPTTAPVALRPHLKVEAAPSEASAESVQAPVQASVQAPVQAEQPAVLPPKTNTGTVQAPVQSTDLLKRAGEDLDFYRANRDAIRKAWLGR